MTEQIRRPQSNSAKPSHVHCVPKIVTCKKFSSFSRRSEFGNQGVCVYVANEKESLAHGHMLEAREEVMDLRY